MAAKGTPDWVWAVAALAVAYVAWRMGWLRILTGERLGGSSGPSGLRGLSLSTALTGSPAGGVTTLPRTGETATVTPQGTVAAAPPPPAAPPPVQPARIDISGVTGPEPGDTTPAGMPAPASPQQIEAARQAGAYLPPITTPGQYYAPVRTETGGVTVGLVNPPPDPAAVAAQTRRNLELLRSVPAATPVPATPAGLVIGNVRFTSSSPTTAGELARRLQQSEQQRQQREAREAEFQRKYGVSIQEFSKSLTAGLRKLKGVL